jgi:hypothetical protein
VGCAKVGEGGNRGPTVWFQLIAWSRLPRDAGSAFVALMNEPLDPDASELPEVIAQRQAKRNLRRAFIFGVVMATTEMGVLLYFMYC